MKSINFKLTLIGLGYLVLTFWMYYTTQERANIIIDQMIEERETLSTQIKLCETISSIKYPDKIKYFHGSEKSNISIDYWKLKSDIKELIKSYGSQNSHSMLILDVYDIYKDQITNEVFLGIPMDIRIKCQADIFQINDSITKIYYHHDKFRLSYMNPIKITYQYFKLDRNDAKIDTTSVERIIHFD